jgi:hypothetical protein
VKRIYSHRCKCQHEADLTMRKIGPFAVRSLTLLQAVMIKPDISFQGLFRTMLNSKYYTISTAKYPVMDD